MPIGAVIGAGALGAAGSVASSVIGSKAASSASSQQAQSAQSALDLQKQMFGTATNALNPYISAGQGALPQLQALLTPGSGQANAIAMNPGLRFQSQWGDLAATNQLSAEGLGGSAGPVGKALSDYNQGLASTYYGNAVSQLQNLVNTGAGAGSALASGAVASGNAMAGTAQNIGNAQASGTLGSANAISGGITGATSGVGNSLLLSQLLGNGGGGGFYGGGSASPFTFGTV